MDTWHPIMAAIEGPTGVWRMIDPQGREYGRIELRRIMNGTDTRYKAQWRGEVIGWGGRPLVVAKFQRFASRRRKGLAPPTMSQQPSGSA